MRLSASFASRTWQPFSRRGLRLRSRPPHPGRTGSSSRRGYRLWVCTWNPSPPLPYRRSGHSRQSIVAYAGPVAVSRVDACVQTDRTDLVDVAKATFDADREPFRCGGYHIPLYVRRHMSFFPKVH